MPVLTPVPSQTGVVGKDSKQTALDHPRPAANLKIPRSAMHARALDLANLSLQDDPPADADFLQSLPASHQAAESGDPAGAAVATSDSSAPLFSLEKMVKIFGEGFKACRGEAADIAEFLEKNPVMINFMTDPSLQLMGQMVGDLALRLNRAVFENKLDLVKQLLRLKQSITPEEATEWFTRPCEQLEENYDEMAKYILGKLLPPHQKIVLSNILPIAVTESHAGWVKFALQAGVSPTISNSEGVPLWDIAVAAHFAQIELRSKPEYSWDKDRACSEILALLRQVLTAVEALPLHSNISIAGHIRTFKTRCVGDLNRPAELKRVLDASRSTLEEVLEKNIEIVNPTQLNQLLCSAVIKTDPSHLIQLLRLKKTLSVEFATELLDAACNYNFSNPIIIQQILLKMAPDECQQILDRGFAYAIINAHIPLAQQLLHWGANPPDLEETNHNGETIHDVIRKRHEECVGKIQPGSSDCAYWSAKDWDYGEAVNMLLELEMISKGITPSYRQPYVPYAELVSSALPRRGEAKAVPGLSSSSSAGNLPLSAPTAALQRAVRPTGGFAPAIRRLGPVSAELQAAIPSAMPPRGASIPGLSPSWGRAPAPVGRRSLPVSAGFLAPPPARAMAGSSTPPRRAPVSAEFPTDPSARTSAAIPDMPPRGAPVPGLSPALERVPVTARRRRAPPVSAEFPTDPSARTSVAIPVAMSSTEAPVPGLSAALGRELVTAHRRRVPPVSAGFPTDPRARAPAIIPPRAAPVLGLSPALGRPALDMKRVPSASARLFATPAATRARAPADAVDRGDNIFLEMTKDGNLAAFRQLLECGADVDRTDQQGRSPLMWAIALRQRKMIEDLLDLNPTANVLIIDNNGATALSLATQMYGEDHTITEAIRQETTLQSAAGAATTNTAPKPGRMRGE